MAAREASSFFWSTSARWAGSSETSADSPLFEAVRQAQNGDAAAFESIYRHHCRRVYALCLRMVKDASEAEDLTQETFLLLFRKIHTFRGESAFSTWLYRLTANVVLMHFRRKKEIPVPLEQIFAREEDKAMPRLECGVEDLHLSGLFDRNDLATAISQLPECNRTTFLLHHVQGYRHAEIAGILKCSIGTSKSHVHRARKQLRKRLTACRREAPITRRTQFAPQ